MRRVYLNFLCCSLYLFSHGDILARNCDFFYYAGNPQQVIEYRVDFIKKEIPTSYFAEVQRPINKGSDLAIEWSKQASDCILNGKNGATAAFSETRTLPRLQKLTTIRASLSAPYENDSYSEIRRINRALNKSLQDFEALIGASEPPKVSYLRGILTQSCGSFEKVSTTIAAITALQLPISLRKGYIRDFCGSAQEASRNEVINNLEKIELQCQEGSQEACDLKDVYDSVDCSRVDVFLNQDFEGLISRFKELDARVTETRKTCSENIAGLVDSCLELNLGQEACLIPRSELDACERLQIDKKYCAP